MMSINERTREVGVLKVLGTDLKDIAMMFLTEALLVGILGGIGGLLLSFVMARLILVQMCIRDRYSAAHRAAARPPFSGRRSGSLPPQEPEKEPCITAAERFMI